MNRRIIAIICCVVLFFQTGSVVYAGEAPKENELYAKSAVLMDADSGRILYEKNGYEALANASTTKILTCILALENCNLDSQVTVSSYAASQPKVHLGMSEGQIFYMRDLLYGLMLESFNDCAVAIAEHIAGDVTGFADMMNRKAKEIGCEDTYFITPNGLDGKDDTSFHHTTASDLAKIMRYCIKQSPKAAEFLEITRADQYSFADVAGQNSYSCVNHNAFLQMMDGALSGKTGFTGTAGYCYVGALERDGKCYIVALLACGWPNNKTYKWADTKKLMTYGIESFYKKAIEEIALDAAETPDIPVMNGQTDTIGEEAWIEAEVSDYSGCGEILLTEGEEVSVSYKMAEKLYAPVEAGEYIGTITYQLGEEILGERQITAGNSVKKIDFSWCLERTIEQLWLIKN